MHRSRLNLRQKLSEVYLDGASTGKMETNLGGKLSFSVELGNGSAVDVKIVKC